MKKTILLVKSFSILPSHGKQVELSKKWVILNGLNIGQINELLVKFMLACIFSHIFGGESFSTRQA